MKNNKIKELVQSKNIIVPIYIYKLMPKLNISLECFIYLMYLYNCGEKILFDPNKISTDLGLSIQQVLDYTDKISNAKLIKFEIEKNDKNISEEYLSLEFFYENIYILMMDNNSTSEVKEIQDNLLEESYTKQTLLGSMKSHKLHGATDTDVDNLMNVYINNSLLWYYENNLRIIGLRICHTWGMLMQQELFRNGSRGRGIRL